MRFCGFNGKMCFAVFCAKTCFDVKVHFCDFDGKICFGEKVHFYEKITILAKNVVCGFGGKMQFCGFGGKSVFCGFVIFYE